MQRCKLKSLPQSGKAFLRLSRANGRIRAEKPTKMDAGQSGKSPKKSYFIDKSAKTGTDIY